MTDSGDLQTALRAQGHRLTKPRTEVWEALRGARRHLTAEEVAASTESQVNLASVYRALSLFTELGIARESKLGTADAARWEVAHPDDQFHLVCDSCSRVEHHGGDLVAQIRSHLEDGHGFTAAGIELSVRGRCARCS